MTPNSSTLTILSWNVNGVRAVYRKGLLDWLARTRPDILCLQETKAEPGQLPPDLLSPAPYKTHWVSAQKKGYSGVAILTQTPPVRISEGLGIKRFDDEGRVIVGEYPDFYLLNIYFPNGKRDGVRLQYKMDFYDAVLKFSQKLRKKNPRIVITGDVNTAHKPIDLARPDENEDVSGFLPIERAWIDKLLKAGYVDTLRAFDPAPQRYTWWDMKTRARERNIGWRIDYHFVSEELKPHLVDAFIMPEVMGSDHCPVGIKLKF